MSPSSPAERPAAAEVIVIETPNLGDRSYVVDLDGLAVVVDPQRDIDRVLDRARRARAAPIDPRRGDPHPQRLRDRRARAGPPLGAVYVVPAGCALAFDATRSATARPSPAAVRPGARSTPRAHPAPPVLRRRGRRRGRRGVHRRLDAVRQRRAPRPHRPGPHARPRPRQWHWCAGSPPRSSRMPPSSRPTGSARSAARAPPSASSRPSADQAVGNPACTLDEDEFVARADRRPGRLPGVLRAHGPGQRRRPRPDRPVACPSAPTPPSCVDASTPASGSSTCARAAIFAEGHLRGTLSFDGDGNAVTYLGWVIPWGTPVDPARRHARARSPRCSASSCASASTARPRSPTVAPTTGPRTRRHRVVPAAPTSASSTQELAADPRPARRSTRAVAPEWHGRPRRRRPARAAARAAGARRRDRRLVARRPRTPVADATVRVYCGSGFRAAAAASMLERAGVPVVHVDEDVDHRPRDPRMDARRRRSSHATFGAALTRD